LTHAYVASGGDAARVKQGFARATGLDCGDHGARALLTHTYATAAKDQFDKGLTLAFELGSGADAMTRALLTHAYVVSGGDASRVRRAWSLAKQLDGGSLGLSRALLTHGAVVFGESYTRAGFALATELEGGFLQDESRAVLTYAYGAAGGHAEGVRQGYALAKELDQGEWDNTSRALLSTSLFERDATRMLPIAAVLFGRNAR
jgi:hypothetical protein